MDTAVCGVLLENGILLEFGSVLCVHESVKSAAQSEDVKLTDHRSRRTANDLFGELFMACLQCMDWKEINMRTELLQNDRSSGLCGELGDDMAI